MKISFINDIAFIKSLKKGNSKAFTYLVEQYHHRLCNYAYGLVNDKDVSEDIVQNVFIKIWKKRKALKDDINLKNYLYKSTYNEFIDHYRKIRPVFSLEKIHIESLSLFVEEDSGNSLEKLLLEVKKEIENLPPKCKQAFLLSKQEGLTNIEISEYLGISIKSVEGHITKAFSILRKTLDKKSHGIFLLLFRSNLVSKTT
ncbi:RNA polymerase sigma factor [Zobellia galactanivorans]|uniref:RNA polymerase ECF-type sigma factor n=1 Tax=Zobellia galactanivorans (strain DSM 12802 / CCUG 47099 / CIP 106680 / NCIMB 13871 / Dsij) TaxID=63186 RepID=G0LA55_ZOBGA|nr:RNA polymerase sigma-70 factor [Zobellia galactanivorans]CAZ95064.1 RNA polymerase ECF-type sigma factor [Zobellia galactanivorans]